MAATSHTWAFESFGPTIVYVGDSHVERLGKYAFRKIDLPTNHQHWFGVGGMTAAGQETRQMENREGAVTRALEKKPSIVVICLGGNDIHKKCHISPILRAIGKICQRFKKNGAEHVYVTGIIPRLVCRDIEPAHFERVRKKLNCLLRIHYGSYYIPLRGISQRDDIDARGVHLNPHGQERLYTLLQEGKVKKTKKYAEVKRRLSLKDSRIKTKEREKKKRKKPDPQNMTVRQLPQASSALFFCYNTQLGPPYHVLVDTNFINFSIKNKLDIIPSMMDCLFAKCIPYITDCVMAELEKLGPKYRVALRIVKDPRFERLPCLHKGTYADDCIVQRVTQHKCYIVATCDKDLKRRIRKVPGVPIMYLQQRRFSIERMPDAFGAPKT